MVKIVKQSYKILTDLDGLNILKKIEIAARTCYKSEDLITEDGESAKKLCKMLVERGHTAMLEFGGMIHVLIIFPRGGSHELVRHRTATSFAQESTRYCDYSKDKHGNEITVILPLIFYELHATITRDTINQIDAMLMSDFYEKYNFSVSKYNQYTCWLKAMKNSEEAYFRLRKLGASPQIARGVLPINLKTEINISTNPTQWRHIFKLRTSPAAHPQIRAIMRSLLKDFKEKIPIIFDDIRDDYDDE